MHEQAVPKTVHETPAQLPLIYTFDTTTYYHYSTTDIPLNALCMMPKGKKIKPLQSE